MDLASWVLVGGAAGILAGILFGDWLDLRKADGMSAREFDYWILGQPRTQATPRWSVARDALHWRN